MKVRGYQIIKDGGIWKAGCVRFIPEDVKNVLDIISKNAAYDPKKHNINFVKEISELRDGQWFCCKYDDESRYGRIRLASDSKGIKFYMCQNEPDMDGDDDDGRLDKMGFANSWVSGSTTAYSLAVYDEDPSKNGKLDEYDKAMSRIKTIYYTRRGTRVTVSKNKCITSGTTLTKSMLGKLLKHVEG